VSELSIPHNDFNPLGTPAGVASPKQVFSLSRRQCASLLDALHESRRRQAAREIDYYRHLLDEAKVCEVRQAIEELTRERIPKIKLCFENGLGPFSSFTAFANRRALSYRRIGFVLGLILALPFALIIFPGLAALNGVRPLSVTNISATDFLSVATFGSVLIGSVAAGLAGFAFSAITGSLLFHWLPPTAAVPLLLACSITTQLFSITALWNTMQWKRCLPILVGGFLGIPVGAFVLQHLSAGKFDVAFGAFLVCYAAYMLWRPNLKIHQDGGGSLAATAIGFAGGITGGAVAFPGAFPTIWCSLRALPKEIQRGTVQPFILIMQVATLAYFSKLGILSVETGKTFLWCAPAVLGGTWIGIRLFRRIDDAMFRRILLVFLLLSGAALIYPTAL
jgi:uncharacterized membrane protein YfcA